MTIRLRRLILALFMLALMFPLASSVRAAEPWLGGGDAVIEDAPDSPFNPLIDGFQPPIVNQARPARNCNEIAPSSDNASLILTDAALVSGGNGARVCLFTDEQWDSDFVVLLNQRNIDEWRQTKRQFLPLLSSTGRDLCRIAFWGSTDANLRRAMTVMDQQDVGRPCEPQIFTHGPDSEARADEVRDAVTLAMSRAEDVFGWTLTFPLRVHVYDDHMAFVNGVWVEGGDDTATPRSLEFVRGSAMTIANGGYGFLLDISGFEDELGLQYLTAHEFTHIVQGGVMGCTCNLPYWAIEGGAEYFASLVVGGDEHHVAQRFRSAVTDQFSRNPPALTLLVRKPAATDQRLTLAGYSRGLAAFRYLADRWGDDSFSRLHHDYPTSNIDRYVAGLATITGQSLDDFDADLGAWLKDQADTLPTRPSPPTTTLRPDGPVAYLATGRPVGRDTFDEVAQFARSEPGLVIAIEWKCTTQNISAEIVFTTPNGQKFGSNKFTVNPGCELDGVLFGFDQGPAGTPMRSLPGTWRADILANGVLQGSTTFVIN